MMLKVQMPAAAGNAAINDGRLPQIIQKTMESLKPESVFFLTERGMRTSIIVFDMADPSQIPVIAEPFFQGLDAHVSFQPVMTLEDLQKGLAQL